MIMEATKVACRKFAADFTNGTAVRSDWRIALGLVLLALLARAGAAFLFADVSTDATIWEYGRQGLCAFQTGGDLCMRDRTGAPYASAYMPPLTSYLWLGSFSMFGDGTSARVAYIAMNVMTGAFSAGLLYLFGREAGLSRPACVSAGLLLCVYPTFVFVSTTYHATNFTIVLLLAFALMLARSLRSGAITTKLYAGLLCGACALTRTEMLLIGAGAGLLLVYRHRRQLRSAILSAAAFWLMAAAVVAPWTVRNYVVFERVIPIANANDYNMWKAFGPYAHGSANQIGATPESRVALESIIASVPLGDAPGARYESRVQDAFAADTARFTAQSDAGRLVRLTVQKVAALWLFDWTDPLTHGFLYWAPWLLVNTLVLVGLYLMAQGRAERMDFDGTATALLLLTMLTLSYAISGVLSRYRMHLEPVLFLFAGVALQALLSAAGSAVVRPPFRRA